MARPPLEGTYGIAMGTLWASMHIVRILVQKGLISPADLDEIYGSLMEGVQSGDTRLAALFETRLDGVFTDLRRDAERLYKPDNQ